MRGSSEGQASVELVLCLPFVAFAAAVIVETGVLAVERARVWQAAREGARVAVVEPDPAAARAAARRVGPLPLSIDIDPPSHLRRQGEALTFRVEHDRDGLVPLVGRLFDDIDPVASATMRIEVP